MILYVSERVRKALRERSISSLISVQDRWDTRFVVFYVIGTLGAAQFVVVYMSGRLEEARFLVFYVSGGL